MMLEKLKQSWHLVFLTRGTAGSRTCMFKIIGMKMRKWKKQQEFPLNWDLVSPTGTQIKGQSGASDNISYTGQTGSILILNYIFTFIILHCGLRSNSQRFHTREEPPGTRQVPANPLPEQVKPSPVNPSAQAQW